jgi:hypothetical protein
MSRGSAAGRNSRPTSSTSASGYRYDGGQQQQQQQQQQPRQVQIQRQMGWQAGHALQRWGQ